MRGLVEWNGCGIRTCWDVGSGNKLFASLRRRKSGKQLSVTLKCDRSETWEAAENYFAHLSAQEVKTMEVAKLKTLPKNRFVSGLVSTFGGLRFSFM